MATKSERLRALEEKHAQIQRQIQAIKARESNQERKNDTRRKILLGGFVLAQMKKHGIEARAVTYESAKFTDYLVNERDRVLFGMAGTAALSPAAASGGAV